MAEEAKKISFGFSKISKKPVVSLKRKNEEESKIQFIDCLEGNAIKLVNGEEKASEDLVIPLKNANVLRDNMIGALKAKREENIKNAKTSKEEKCHSNGDSNQEEKKTLTLDELAAKEILEDLKKSHEKDEVKVINEIPTSNVHSLGEKESTLEDYENVPVQEFGLAVLRGMGWAPEKGIGKSGQIVQPVNPVVRPKGMGLGADKVLPTITITANQEELVMKKNAMLKVISGPYKNLYGKVEGFDELPGRIMVRLTLQNTVISISENLVTLVTSAEYNKNSKILNLNDFNEYHNKSALMTSNKNIRRSSSSDSEAHDQNSRDRNEKKQQSSQDRKHIDRESPYVRSRPHEVPRKSKERRRASSDSSDSGSRNRKIKKEPRKSRSSSSDDEKTYQRSKTGKRKSPSRSTDIDHRHKKLTERRIRSPSSESEYSYKYHKSKSGKKPSTSYDENYKRNRRNQSDDSSSEYERKVKSKRSSGKVRNSTKYDKDYGSSPERHSTRDRQDERSKQRPKIDKYVSLKSKHKKHRRSRS